jgi:hypothetical protein
VYFSIFIVSSLSLLLHPEGMIAASSLGFPRGRIEVPQPAGGSDRPMVAPAWGKCGKAFCETEEVASQIRVRRLDLVTSG